MRSDANRRIKSFCSSTSATKRWNLPRACSGPIRSPIGYVPRCISVPGRSDLLQNPVSDLVGAVFHFVAFVIAKPLAAILRRVAIAPACRFDVDRSCTVSRHSGGKALASIRYNTRRDLDFCSSVLPQGRLDSPARALRHRHLDDNRAQLLRDARFLFPTKDFLACQDGERLPLCEGRGKAGAHGIEARTIYVGREGRRPRPLGRGKQSRSPSPANGNHGLKALWSRSTKKSLQTRYGAAREPFRRGIFYF